jgi:hypothetical protein
MEARFTTTYASCTFCILRRPSRISSSDPISEFINTKAVAILLPPFDCSDLILTSEEVKGFVEKDV